MVGPVLYQEMLLGGRRGRQYAFRWIYAGWLVVQLIFLYLAYRGDYWASALPFPLGDGRPDTNATARFARGYVELFVKQQLILLLLITPAITCGAVSDEKTRGTLQYLLTTDLLSWEVILGKLLGRVAQVAVLALAGLPMLCFIGIFGGLEPLLLLALAAVTVIPLFALGSASLLASVWCKQTRDAVLTLFALGTLGYLAVAWLGGPLRAFDPLTVLEPAWGQSELVGLKEVGARLLEYALAWGSITVVCLGLAVWRLRPAYIRQMQGEGRNKKVRWWRVRRAAVSTEPVRWKERHVEGLAPVTALRRLPRWLGMLVIFLATAAASGSILYRSLARPTTPEEILSLLLHLDLGGVNGLFQSAAVSNGFLNQGIVAMLLGSLLVGVRCSGAVTGERERQTWEALLLTPLSVRSLIRGKLWGIIGASYPYLFAYAVPALALAALGSPGSFFWIAIGLGVTWLAMYFLGATGVWCSVRARGSWRSLLGTLGIGYVGGALMFCVTSPITMLLAILIGFLLAALDNLLGTGFGVATPGGWIQVVRSFYIAACLVLAAIFLGLSWYFVADAQKWVADRERTRHWRDEGAGRDFPRRRRRSSRPRYYR